MGIIGTRLSSDKAMPIDSPLIKSLDERRRALGLSYQLLSERCGVSRPTLKRILSGNHPAASLTTVVAIAESIGLGLRFDPLVDTRTLQREQAERKARNLVALVQGTSGLEGQAVDEETVDAMIERTTLELLAGSKQRLWSEG